MHLKRIWLLRVFSIFCGFLLLALAEALLHLVPSLSPPPLVITLAEEEDRALRSINPLYPAVYFAQQFKSQPLSRGRMTPQPFIIPAALPIYRVVLVGASTIQGFPHPHRLAAAAFLKAMLQDALPEHQVEVFNLGITSIASFAVAQTLADALALEPDAVVVYTGHNEFYGIYGSQAHKTTFHNTLHYNLMQWRTPRLLAKLVDPLLVVKSSSATLLETLGQRGHVPLDSHRRRFVQEELAANLRRMIALCRQNQTPLVLCTLVSNDTGFAPAASSDPPLTGDLSAQWQAWIEVGETVLGERKNAAQALESLDRAQALWANSAWLWYLKGRALIHLGRSTDALAAFRRSRDLDIMPWRAPSSHNETIRWLAATEKVLLADVEQAFLHTAPPQGIGWELMGDHVHPSLAGQILLARTILAALQPIVAPKTVLWDQVRTDASYRTLLGDLPVEQVALQRTIAALLGKGPMARYNAHNVRFFQNLAATGWKALSKAEQRGLQEWTQDPTQVPLVLEVADRLFTAEKYPQAQAHYAAARRQAPFTLRGDLWAAVRWAWTLQMQRKELTLEHRRKLQLALTSADFLAQGKSPVHSTPILNYIRGQLHYFLQQHQQALPYLEAAFDAKQFRRPFMDTLFPVLAAELFYAGRAEDARRLARLASAEERGNPYYIQLVETLSRNRAQPPLP